MALSAKQQLFVAEYLVDLNATQAAIRAGYSEKTARAIGNENLTKPDIAAEIQKAMSERAKKVEITADWVLYELKKLAQSNMGDYMQPSGPDGDPALNFADLTRDQMAALQEVTIETTTVGVENPATTKRVKFKLYDKRASLVDIGRHLGMFKDKTEITHTLSLEQLVIGSMKPRE